jgi:hypothetical protein
MAPPETASRARAEPTPSPVRAASVKALHDAATNATATARARPAAAGQRSEAAAPAAAADLAAAGGQGPHAGHQGAAVLRTSAELGSAAGEAEPEAPGLAVEPLAEIEPLAPMEPVPTPSLAPLWPIPVALAGDVFSLRAAKPGKPAAEKPKGQDAPRAEDDPDRQKEADDVARREAARAYEALVDFARRLQQGFVDEAKDIAAAMARAAERAGSDLTRRHEGLAADLDHAAERARQDVEAAAAEADTAMEDAFRAADAALSRASRRAHGSISANERTADAQIGQIIDGLVGGHRKAYDDGIAKVTTAANNAVAKLQAWNDDRNTTYPTEGVAPLPAAENESVRLRVPPLSSDAQKAVKEHKDSIVTSWGSSRDAAVCGLSCQFRPELDKHKVAMHTQGHAAVAKALKNARDTLERQHRDGKQALTNLLTSARTQIDTQRHNARARLTGQANASLEATHRESRAAVDGIGQATRASLPSYWRGVQGFEQALRRSGPRGPQEVRKTARDGGAPVRRNLELANRGLMHRLNDNQRRHETAIERRVDGFDDHGRALVAETVDALRRYSEESSSELAQTGRTTAAGFAGHDRAVTQSAESWARPISKAMAGFISQSQTSAQESLTALLTGQQPKPPATTTPSTQTAAAATAQANQQQPAATCGSCPSTGEGAEAGAQARPPVPPRGPGGIAVNTAGKPAPPKGLTEQIKEAEKFATDRSIPAQFFARELAQVRERVRGNLDTRSSQVAGGLEAGIIDKVDEGAVTGALRGLTQLKGHALDVTVYPDNHSGRTLRNDLRQRMGGGTDYEAAIAYLNGNAVEGARLELQASMHWYNDEEARIEATMRALSPEQIRALGRSHAGVLDDVHDALDGTDREAFDALRQADPAHATDAYARADAIRLRARIDELRRDGNHDAVHAAIVEFTSATEEGYGGQELSAEERRTAVVRELGNLVSDADVAYAAGQGGVGAMTAEQRAVAYVTRDIEVEVGGGPDYPPQTITLKMEGANRDLARDLLLHGEGSVEARASRLGVELQRSGDTPNALNLDRAMFDDRFTPDNPNATPEEREANEARRRQARADRAQVLLLAAQRYANEPPPPEGTTVTADQALRDPRVVSAREALISRLQARYGDETLGAQLARGLLTDERPSPETAAIAMRHAMYSRTGTDEELLFRFTERMNRDEIAQMREAFTRQTGRSLDAELGVYGEGGWFTELSGDDRLRMERAMLGVARTDQERLENAAFAINQQRNETGALGRWLASGSLAEEAMNATYRRLITSAGGNLSFDRRGNLITPAAFDARGNYTGTDRATFIAAANAAQQVAQNYSSRIDAYANLATTGIMILGAIAGAVITVATGGAAGPLVAAALITGLASMAAQYALKGGRYGWEQAAVDLGMTAVQALTAGVGAQLGAAAQVASKGAQAANQASRVVATLARAFTGNRILDQIIIGAISGGISGLGAAALNEQTWARGAEGGIGGLLDGLLKGMLAGAATAAVTNSIESIGRQGRTIGDRLQQLSAQGPAGRATLNMLMRGGARGIISATGGMSGRSIEILYDAARGHFRGDSGDALVLIGEAGLHSALQGFGEGAGEAHGQRIHNRTLRAAEVAINRERTDRGLPPLSGHALEGAAADLIFLNQHGRNGGDRLGRALNLDHVASHGGMAVPEAEVARTPATGDAAAAVKAAAPSREEAATAAIRAAGGGEEPSPLTRGPTANEAAEAAARIAHAPEADTHAPRPAAGEAEPPRGGKGDGGGGGDGGEGGGGRPPPPEDDRLFPHLTDAEIDAAFAPLAAGPLVHAPAEELGLRWPAAQGGYWGVEAATGMTVQEYRFLAARGIPRLDPAGNPVAGPRRNVMTRMRIHSPDPTAPVGSVSRERWTVSFEQGNARLTADGRWFDTRYGEAPGGRRVDVRPYERGASGDWVERGTGRPVTDPHVRAALDSWDRNMAASHIPLHPGEPPARPGGPAEGGTPPQGGGPRPSRPGGPPEEAGGGPARAEPPGPETPTAPRAAGGGAEPAALRPRPRAEGTEAPAPVRPAVEEAGARVRVAAEEPTPRMRIAAEEGEPARVRVAAEEREAPRLRIASPEEAERAVLAEAEATAAARAAEPKRARMTGDTGAAARLPGTEMELAGRPVITDAPAALRNVMRELSALETSLIGMSMHADAQGPGLRVSVPVGADGPVTVRIIVGDTAGGDVASFRPGTKADGADYVVTLSRQAREASHARAIAHELAEIRDIRRGVTADDVLRPGAPVEPGESRLSAHDRGRLAELEVLAGRLRAAEARNAPPEEIARIRHEAELLVSALGMVGGRPAQQARRQLAEGALADTPAARSLLGEATASAAKNPFLTPLRGDLDDMVVLARQAEHARSLGDPALEMQAIALARRLIEEGGFLTANGDLIAQPLRAARTVMKAAGAETETLFNRVLAEAQAARRPMRERAEQLRPLRDAEADASRASSRARAADEEAVRLRRTAAERDQLADRIEERNPKRAAELRAEADSLRQEAADQTAYAAEQRARAKELGERARLLRETSVEPVTAPPTVAASARRSVAADLANDPVQRELVRQRFGDNEMFQDWGEFRRAYFDANPSVRRDDPAVEGRLFAEWQRGSYVDRTTGRINALKDLRVLKPWAAAAEAVRTRVPEDQLLTISRRTETETGETLKQRVDLTPSQVAAERTRLITRRDEIEILLDPDPKVGLPADHEQRPLLERELVRVLADLNEASEALGVAAGRQFAAEQGWPTAVPIPRGGSGVPDLAYRDGGGRLILIECKGPRAKAQTRGAEVAGEPVRAQQGTPEYVMSLARDMATSSDPQIRSLGEAILKEMPNVGYYLVQQTVNDDPGETLSSIKAQRYDMRTPGR